MAAKPATAPIAAVSPRWGRKHVLRDRIKNRQRIVVGLDGAAASGRIRDVGFRNLKLIAKATSDVFADATDDEHDQFLEDCLGDGDGETISLLRDRIVENLGVNGGGFLDILLELLPIFLPLIMGCFA